MMRVSSDVPAGIRDVPLVEYLAQRFTYMSSSAWEGLIVAGHVTVDDVEADANTHVSAGDIVTCYLPDVPQPAVNLNYHIIYEDPWLLAIDKPGNLRVHSSGKFVRANLIYHLRHEHEPPYPEAQLVNRLDAGTSGVLLVARDADVRRILGEQLAQGAIEKTYLAVVHGTPSPASGVVDLATGPEPGARIRSRQGVDIPSGRLSRVKKAVTHYETIRELTGDRSLLRLQPYTGRTHQLRVHLAAIGHRLVGDALYAMDDDSYLRWVRQGTPFEEMQRQALHCQRMAFRHPKTGLWTEVKAPLASDIAKLVD